MKNFILLLLTFSLFSCSFGQTETSQLLNKTIPDLEESRLEDSSLKYDSIINLLNRITDRENVSVFSNRGDLRENYTRVSQFSQWIHEEIAGKGTASGAILRVAPKPNATVYKPKAIAVSASALQQYVGEYEIQGMIMKTYTKENDTKLYLFVPGDREYEFIPTSEHEFSSIIAEGFNLKFKKAENGVFNKLIILQPDVTYELTRK